MSEIVNRVTPTADGPLPAGSFVSKEDPHGRFLASARLYLNSTVTSSAKRTPNERSPSLYEIAGDACVWKAEMREEVLPKNILMIGPTGCGKTEIARRLARLADAPFLKVEATKFTEVGYVGRDVEQIVRDLVEVAISLVKERRRKGVERARNSPPRSACLTRWWGPRPPRRRVNASQALSRRRIGRQGDRSEG